MNRTKYTIFSIIAIAVILGIGVTSYSQPQNQALEEDIQVHGFFTLQVYDQFGNLKQTVHTPNTVVDVGIDCMADLVFGSTVCTSEAFFQYIQIGTGTTGPTSSDTTLETAIGGCSRIQDSTPSIASPIGEITATLEVTFSGATCAASVTEAGVFD